MKRILQFYNWREEMINLPNWIFLSNNFIIEISPPESLLITSRLQKLRRQLLLL